LDLNKFVLKSKYSPTLAQKTCISSLTDGLEAGYTDQVMLGVTGSGKTFVMANLIKNVQKPTLVLAHNKTLAAQLFSEFKEYFPNNSVKYFVSYYDYYQPEAYIPKRDLYIEKESQINEVIEKYRNAATQSLLTRSDTLIIASVSCIYGLGDPDDYMSLSRTVRIGDKYSRDKFLRHLSDMQYERSHIDFYGGLFRVRGDTVEIYLSSDDKIVRIEYFGDEIESIKIINPVSGEILEKPTKVEIFPAKHFVTPYETLKEVIPTIESDLKNEVDAFKTANKMVEAYRLEQRVKFDMEMMRETGYCSGIENYSRYINKRSPGSAPSTLLDYFPDDWLLIVDESHITIPQTRGMYHGDLARKSNLVDFGFRLKAALDNRPLKFQEFRSRLNQTIYCSATPEEYELSLAQNKVELLVRPTGLLDPQIELRPITVESFSKLKAETIANGYLEMPITKETECKKNQIDDLLIEVEKTTKKGSRVLITTLTKRMAEDLSSYLLELNIKVTYIHSELDAIKRVELLRDLRKGKYDVLVGINLLREGLDLPEVSLIVIMDADKEGFLRSRTSLVQTIGRAARHLEGKVIMYAGHITGSMKYAIDETLRRRKAQAEYNQENNIVAKSIQKDIKETFKIIAGDKSSKNKNESDDLFKRVELYSILSDNEKKRLKKEIEIEMNIRADSLEFEVAADLRDLLSLINHPVNPKVHNKL